MTSVMELHVICIKVFYYFSLSFDETVSYSLNKCSIQQRIEVTLTSHFFLSMLPHNETHSATLATFLGEMLFQAAKCKETRKKWERRVSLLFRIAMIWAPLCTIPLNLILDCSDRWEQSSENTFYPGIFGLYPKCQSHCHVSVVLSMCICLISLSMTGKNEGCVH